MIKKNFLVLAPHTDDGELGCGATIAKLIEEGNNVYYVAFSACEESLPAGYEKNTLRIEVKNATSRLGIVQENIYVLQYPVRNFANYRQDILEDMIGFRKKINPDVVFLPSCNDIHQDHIVINQEGIRAFKYINILGYELPWNNLSHHNVCFQPLSKKYIEKKTEALLCYESQKDRAYISRESIFSLAKIRGVQIQKEYAECFQVIRWIL